MVAAEYEFLTFQKTLNSVTLYQRVCGEILQLYQAFVIFVRGTNLLTFSKFDLWDPEVENTTGAAYPIMKSLSAGFEIKF